MEIHPEGDQYTPENIKRRLLLRAKTTFKLTVKPFLTFLTHVAGSSAFEIKNQKSFSK